MASSKRERELARQRAARQAARRAERERRRKRRSAIIAGSVAVVLVVLAAVAAVITNRGGSSKSVLASGTATPSPSAAASAPASTAPSGTPTPAAAGDCAYPAAGTAAKPVQPPPAKADRATAYTATIATSQGDIALTLLTSKAPCTVNSFKHLADTGYYSGTPCHRLTDQGIFVLQCGDPTGTGRGGPGYSFPDENLTGATYPRGTVAMANSGADTNGSQFFLVYKDSTLPPQYTPFGTISEAGLAVLDKVAAAGATAPDANGNTAPKTPVQISNITVKPAAG